MLLPNRVGGFIFRFLLGVDADNAEPRGRITGFIFRLLLFYGLLSAPWPGVHEAYSACTRAVGNAVFGSFGSDGVVRFMPLPDAKGGMDTAISIKNVNSPVVGKLPHSNWFSGYLPMVEVVALILATPIPWKRRWKSLFWGILLVNVFVGLRVWVTLLHGFSMDQPCALYHPSPFWMGALTDLYNYFALSSTCSFVIPALIWILVTFRESDLRAMVSPAVRGTACACPQCATENRPGARFCKNCGERVAR